MTNSLSKEEIVLFNRHLKQFENQINFARNVKVLNENPVVLERSQNTLWYPIPRIAYTRQGLDQTGNFSPTTQLSAPITIGEVESYPFFFTAIELNDIYNTEGEEIKRAMESMASAVNVSILNAAINQSTIVITRTNAAGATNGHQDIAQATAAMTRVGVSMMDRRISLNPDDEVGLTSWISSKETMNEVVLQGYRADKLGTVSNFQTVDQQLSFTITGVPAGTTAVVDGDDQNVTPTTLSTTAGQINNDNQTQSFDMTVTNGPVKAGDCFTIDGVYEVTHVPRSDGSLQKLATTHLKTFRIISVDSGGTGATTVTISPQIVSNDGSTIAQIEYQNVSAAPVDQADITFLNTDDAPANVFWTKEAIQFLPAKLYIPPQAGAFTTESVVPPGITVRLTKQFDINTMNTFYRIDARWGVNVMNREMAGILLFNQAVAT